MRFFSPFETNCRSTGWRWYLAFLRAYPDMVLRVEADCFTCLIERGLVCA